MLLSYALVLAILALNISTVLSLRFKSPQPDILLEKLVTAAKKNSIGDVVFVLSRRADIPLGKLEEALKEASKNKNPQISELLLTRVFDQGVVDVNEIFVLAATDGHSDVVKLIREKAANKYFQIDFEPAILGALAKGHSKVAIFLLETYPEIRPPTVTEAFELAAEKCNYDALLFIMEKYCDSNTCNFGEALIKAATAGRIRNVKALLDKDHLIKDTDFAGAVCGAAANNHIDIIEALCSKNARPHYYFSRAFHIAAKNGHESSVETLLKYYGNSENISGYINHALWGAAESGKLQIVKMLVDRFSKLDVNDLGIAFSRAATNGQKEVVGYLQMRFGASLKTEHVGSALIGACHGGRLEIVKCILPFHSGIISREDFGRALIRAAGARNLAIFRLILKTYKDIKTEDLQEALKAAKHHWPFVLARNVYSFSQKPQK